MNNKKGFTLAEVLIEKRESGEMSLLNLARARELKEPFSRLMKQCAFTLAEVLITLGIIGVVAALTIPTLMHNQRNAELKSGFMKANAMVNTVVNQLVYEKGITQLRDEYCYWNNDACKSGEYTGMNSGQKLIKDMTPYLKYTSINTEGIPWTGVIEFPVRTIINEDLERRSVSQCPAINLQDGSILYIAAPSAAFPQLVVDTNGHKGPNKYGYDVFWWRLEGTKAVPQSWNYGDGENCALTSGQYSGVTCAQYAIVDKCPWDDTKGYWECLP